MTVGCQAFYAVLAHFLDKGNSYLAMAGKGVYVRACVMGMWLLKGFTESSTSTRSNRQTNHMKTNCYYF